MRPVRTFAFSTLCAFAVIPSSPIDAVAQMPPVRELERPEFEYPQPFTTITGVRELGNGTLIVADAREMRLELIDSRSGKVTRISREGSGPGEWGILTRLHALPGDSTLMFDPRNGRFLLITGDGSVSTPLFELADGTRLDESLMDVDHHGGLYYTRRVYPPGQRRTSDTPLSTVVMRYDRHTRRVDTLATLAVPRDRSTGARNLGDGLMQFFDNRPFGAEDVAAAAFDGRLAVVRSRDFHVEWIGRDGRVTTGPGIAYQPIRITDDEKRAYLRSLIRPGSIVVRGSPGGDAKALPMGSAGAPRVPRSTDVKIDDPTITWPATKPPFVGNAARIAPDGLLWLQRTSTHDDKRTTWDLFDRAGRPVARVILPPNTRLLGFGDGTVYVARKDNDDLEWLQRHRL